MPMRIRLLSALIAGTLPLLLGCGVADAPAMHGGPGIVSGGGVGDATGARAAIEQAVKADLARFLQVDAAEIAVLETAARVWPDALLGCGTQRGVVEPAPTPGYLIRLGHGQRSFEYHTAANGRFVRCMPRAKPRGPITR